MASWDELAERVLLTADAREKAAMAEELLGESRPEELASPPSRLPPARPARPDRPHLVPPREVAKRGLGKPEGRAALLHALAHIELNAVDLAADMALRFAGEVPEGLRAEFVGDWFQVMGEEGLHFRLLEERLREYGSRYGALPAHDGLWQAAIKTSDSLLARLAVAPLILEARGLDVTPGMARKLCGVGDGRSADILDVIYRDEIGHVRTGAKWFRLICRELGHDPAESFHICVTTYHPQGATPPFNGPGRAQADLPRDWYEGVASRDCRSSA
ncbi:ferritin-like domain-containing protein [Parvularcula maris]|uniref:Ferritin-like domain-containing protein n=1 Tax=Parvularcula maris TaxID=2965077 RepID=A0A9X2RI65_9PROT|nr:ferritin-like domain-containing protein [Parvularcula maris]MCQ8185715.1 ferritin-like domain-containing protein [Parvularcula maris]